MLTPHSLDEIQEAVRGAEVVLPVGSRSKSALAICSEPNVTYIDMRAYSGIVSYDPGEYLVTVRAGTKVRDLALVLLAQGQYLPFDPCLANEGSTIGGAVGCGISGPCRLLYGGLRDFMLEVAIVDSLGREVRGGGKVVKNAAGFDLPKLFVGSYGRLGVLTEITLKVFPTPPAWTTLVVHGLDCAASVHAMQQVLGAPLPIAAAEIDEMSRLLFRVAGPPASLTGMRERVKSCLPKTVQVETVEHGETESSIWRDRSEFSWTAGHTHLVRAAVTQQQIPRLDRALAPYAESLRHVYSCGGSVCWIAADGPETIDLLHQVFADQHIAGVVVRGPVPDLTAVGDCRWTEFSERVRKALDPAEKFPRYQRAHLPA